MTAVHIPVLLNEVVRTLAPRPGGAYVDGTFGAGGYTEAILGAAHCRVAAIDCDPDAMERGRALRDRYRGRLTLIEGRFGDMERLVRTVTDAPVDGVALDIGVSSPQLDTPERGFSFRHDGPLDMRMSRSGPTAADVVNRTAEAELSKIVFTLGEERAARRIARAIVNARRGGAIERTLQLAEIVRSVVPAAAGGIDPATRTFQALRLYVNGELEELDRGLRGAERLLRPGGRLAVGLFSLPRGQAGETLPARPQRRGAARLASPAGARPAAPADVPPAVSPRDNAFPRRNCRQPARALVQIARCGADRQPGLGRQCGRFSGRRRGMIRWTTIVLLVLLSGMTGALFPVKHQVQTLEKQVGKVEASIRSYRNNIRISSGGMDPADLAAAPWATDAAQRPRPALRGTIQEFLGSARYLRRAVRADRRRPGARQPRKETAMSRRLRELCRPHARGARCRPGEMHLEGAAGKALSLARRRLIVTGAVFLLAFCAIGYRLVDLGVIRAGVEAERAKLAAKKTLPSGHRADIVDRNGIVLATSIGSWSIFADPTLVDAPGRTARILAHIFPQQSVRTLETKLRRKTRFVWIARQASPAAYQQILRFGLAGIQARPDLRRVYPQRALVAHIVGSSDVDNKGIAGVEARMDNRIRTGARPLGLSIDLRAQAAVRGDSGPLDRILAGARRCGDGHGCADR